MTDSINGQKEKRKRGMSPGCGFLPVVILTGLGFLVCGFLPVFLGSVLFEQQWFAPGDASRFDPIASYQEIADFAGGKEYTLAYFSARYVRSDGTLDLYASYDPYVVYQFVREIDPPGGRMPLGVGSSPEGQYFETVQVRVENTDFILTMDRNTWQSSSPEEKELLDIPLCSLADLWAVALEKGAPESAVAVIHYTTRGYAFSIDGTSIRLNFDKTCQPVS